MADHHTMADLHEMAAHPSDSPLVHVSPDLVGIRRETDHGSQSPTLVGVTALCFSGCGLRIGSIMRSIGRLLRRRERPQTVFYSIEPVLELLVFLL